MIQGEFEIVTSAQSTGTSAATIPLKDFVDKYILTQGRTFTPEEEATIPILPSWYIIPPEIKQICEHAQKTTGSHAMRNFLLRGPAGTGKSEGAKAIAAAMHLPYRFLTCSAGTEIFDLIGQIMPAMNPKPKENNHWERPTFMDIQMDPASVHYAFTKEYDESVDENTVFDEVLQFMEERIRAERALARVLNISKYAVNTYECQRAAPTAYVVYKVSDYFHIPMELLLTRTLD